MIMSNLIEWTTEVSEKRLNYGSSGWKGYHNYKGKHIMELRNNEHGCTILIKVSREKVRYSYNYEGPRIYRTELRIRMTQNGGSVWYLNNIDELSSVFKEAVDRFNRHSKVYQLEDVGTVQSLRNYFKGNREL